MKSLKELQLLEQTRAAYAHIVDNNPIEVPVSNSNRAYGHAFKLAKNQPQIDQLMAQLRQIEIEAEQIKRELRKLITPNLHQS